MSGLKVIAQHNEQQLQHLCMGFAVLIVLIDQNPLVQTKN